MCQPDGLFESTQFLLNSKEINGLETRTKYVVPTHGKLFQLHSGDYTPERNSSTQKDQQSYLAIATESPSFKSAKETTMKITLYIPTESN